MKISDFGGEAAIIELIRDRYGAEPGGELALGIGDDAALIGFGERLLIVTTDLLVENTHFRMDLSEPYLVGWKSAAVNISDIAAMGGEPTYSFVSIGLPDVEVETVESIYQGLHDANAAFGSVIAGGDTVGSSAGIVINVTQLGVVERDLVTRRDGARVGDAILVTNTLGDSLAGLELLLKLGLADARRASAFCVERHLKPEPRVREARAAVRTGNVHSMMDLSDGLSSDLTRLCAASKVGARVCASDLPLSPDIHVASARLDADPVALAASGGEDYELLITCETGDAPGLVEAIRSTGSPAGVIGEIVEGTGVVLLSPDGGEGPMPESWQHF